jgi:hypothetical protein
MYHLFYAVPGQIPSSRLQSRRLRAFSLDRPLRWFTTGISPLIHTLFALGRVALLLPTVVLVPVTAIMWYCARQERRELQAVEAQKRAWILEMEAMDRF